MKIYQVKEITGFDSPETEMWTVEEELLDTFSNKDDAEKLADEKFKEVWIHEEDEKVVDESRRIVAMRWDTDEEFPAEKLDPEEWYNDIMECIQIVVQEVDVK
jgi:hypothetical protein